jgi:hypothetical protein
VYGGGGAGVGERPARLPDFTPDAEDAYPTATAQVTNGWTAVNLGGVRERLAVALRGCREPRVAAARHGAKAQRMTAQTATRYAARTMAARLDLFSAAEANADSLHARFHALREAEPRERALLIHRFADRVHEGGRLSINMPMSVLERFLSRGEYLNVHEVVAWEATHSSKPAEQLLQERLPGYYERRIAFDRSLERGEEFRYGFLSIGGPGPSFYGEFCVVFQESFPAELLGLAYLPADSLKHYLLPGPTLDREALRQDAAPHSQRHCLAALKHAAAVAADLPEDRWPALLCSEEDYIEAIFVGSPIPAAVAGVRLPRINFEAYYYFAFEEARGRMGKDDRHLADAFKSILRLLEDQDLDLEDV